MKIKVAKKESGGSGKPVALFDDTGVRFSGFLPGLNEVNEGDTIEAEINIIKKGEKTYNNITSCQVIEHGTTPQPHENKKPLDSVKVEVTARARNTALMQAVETYKATTDMVQEGILPLADRYAHWLLHGEIKPAKPNGFQKAQIDEQWLKESLETLAERDKLNWSTEAVLGYMVGMYKVKGSTIQEAARKLDHTKAKHFVQKIEEALDGMA